MVFSIATGDGGRGGDTTGMTNGFCRQPVVVTKVRDAWVERLQTSDDQFVTSLGVQGSRQLEVESWQGGSGQ